MSFIWLFLIGTLIGVAMITPGVSGAVIAVIFGVYDKMITALINLFKDFKKSFIFLAVLGLGILVGAVWFSNVMIFLYERHEVVTKLAFVGLILGGVPFLFKEIREKNGEKINYVALILTFMLSTFLWILSNSVMQIDLDCNTKFGIISVLNLFLAGMIYSIGKIVPGVSGSFLLIIIGMYEYVLSIMAHPITVGLNELNKLIPFVFGLVVGVILLLKLMNYLLKEKFGLTYSIIIGFVIGAIPALIPKINSFKEFAFGMIIMVISFVLSYKLTK